MENKNQSGDEQKPAEDAVVLAPRERDTFDGVTIEQPGANEPGNTHAAGQRQQRASEQSSYVKTVSVGGGWGMLLGWLIILGILFIVLPAFFLFALAGAVIWFILRLFR